MSGDIYWFTDDIDKEEMSDIYDWANNNSHKVNILGVGSKTGAPIKLSSGKLLKDNKGAIVIPKLPESRLAAISKRSRGVYHTMTNDDSDIKALTAHLNSSLDDKVDSGSSTNANGQQSEHQSKQAMQGDQYQEQGPWLLIIILPLLLTYFRRGSNILAITWLMPLTLLFSLSSISPVSFAASESDTLKSSEKSTNESSANTASQLWQDLWQTSDQQAQAHYQQKDYPQAAKQFEDTQWQGSAHYKAGDYEQALQAFKQSDSAQALYNQGNSLAQLQKVDEAIDAYKKALEKDPTLSDAKDNLEKLEAFKKQQEQQEQESQGDQKDQDSEDQSQGDQQEQKEQGNQESQEGQKDSQDQSEGDQQQSDQEQGKQDDKQAQDAQQQAQDEQQKEEEQVKQAEASDDEQDPNDEKSLAQQASDSKKQETEQKHQQLLNKVTDDPYLLLRNKMRLEYQKRRSEGTPQGVTKKW